MCVFFFQAEDGIRDFHVTGVQTCALPILTRRRRERLSVGNPRCVSTSWCASWWMLTWHCCRERRRESTSASCRDLFRNTAALARWICEWTLVQPFQRLIAWIELLKQFRYSF